MAEHRMVNLDAKTRKWMIEELRYDIEHDNLYFNAALSDRGRREYPEILKEAFEHHDEIWLANALGSGDRMNLDSTSTHQTDVTGDRVTAFEPELLGKSEFNRYYARGLCRRAMDEGIDELEIYKYTDYENPHFVYQTLVVGNDPSLGVETGRRVDPKELLEELRKSPEAELDTGIPGEPHSGLSVRLPAR